MKKLKIKKKMEYSFINRDRNVITFIEEGDTFEMKGGDYYRYLFNVDKDGNFESYHAVDPSGGPFIGVGMDMGYIHDDLKGLVVESIEKKDDRLFLKTNKI
jgi:hypothetical protein